MVMKDWRSAAPVAAVPATPRKLETPAVANPGVGTPRRVPAGVEVNDYNAQKFYSTKECLFVANLPTEGYDRDIQAEIYELFKPYGICYIKIQRDQKRMPQAFVQYTSRKDAERAMEGTKKLIVRGRAARIEWSKANREYHVSHKDGSVVTEDEAREFLAPFGALERIANVDIAASAAGLSTSGLLVIFENYQSGRDAVRLTQDSDEWTVVEHDRDGARRKAAAAPSLRSKRSQAEIEDYAVDRNSIFCGNLRENTNEYAIRELCKEFGKVVSVDIHVRPSNRDGCDKNVFAYVEFTNPEEVKAAVNGLRGRPFQGQRLKVDQKRSPEQLYGKNATPVQTDRWAQLNRTGFQVAHSPMGHFGVITNGQHGIPSSPYSPAPYGTPGLGYASPYYPAGPQAYASPIQHGHPAVQMNSLYGVQTGTETAAQPSVGYGSTGNWVQHSGAQRYAYPPNAPFPSPGQPHGQVMLATPPHSAAYPYPGYSQGSINNGAPPGYLQYYGQPQPQVAPGYAVSGHFQGPSSLYPPINGGILPPNAQYTVHAGTAAAQHNGVGLGDHAYGREQDLPAVQSQVKADAIADKYLGDGAMISPKKVVYPNEPCSVSDIIAGPHDDEARSEAMAKLDTFTIKDGVHQNNSNLNKLKQLSVKSLKTKEKCRRNPKVKAAKADEAEDEASA